MCLEEMWDMRVFSPTPTICGGGGGVGWSVCVCSEDKGF